MTDNKLTGGLVEFGPANNVSEKPDVMDLEAIGKAQIMMLGKPISKPLTGRIYVVEKGEGVVDPHSGALYTTKEVYEALKPTADEIEEEVIARCAEFIETNALVWKQSGEWDTAPTTKEDVGSDKRALANILRNLPRKYSKSR
jgi:hypothetical protein